MFEKIVKIDFTEEQLFTGDQYQGYNIETNKQTLKFYIKKSQSIQTDVIILNPYGINSLEDCNLLDIRWGNKIECEYIPDFLDNAEYICINLLTDKGLFQIVLYNDSHPHLSQTTYVSWNNYEKFTMI